MSSYQAPLSAYRLVADCGLPEYPSENLDVDMIDLISRDVGSRSAAAACYTLNRVHTWLRETKDRFEGAEGLEAEWTKHNGIITCHLKPAEGTESWKVVWGTKYGVEDIKVTSIVGDLETPLLEGAFYERKKGTEKKDWQSGFQAPDPNTVTGSVSSESNLKDVSRFTKAITPHIPDAVKEFTSTAVPDDYVGRLSRMRPMIDADGGLPGKLCWMNYALSADFASQAIATFVVNNHQQMVERLDNLNAKWGEGCLVIGDDDADVCVVRSDGAVAIFYADHATASEKNTGLILFRLDGEKAKTLEMHVFEQSDDVASQVSAIMKGEVTADYRMEIEGMHSKSAFTAKGYNALNAMSWWFVIANDPNYEDVEPKQSYWAAENETPSNVGNNKPV
ncbi:hypothetical protein [Mesorhizobium sp. SP-1A]|uniref:hypothetical protein n=1 Tax=Mesorhizobium sp. SP-1A TaxID=3077840 RepID=UPI0028F70433|nr:hypothetical protein [Mesorhizobium sp. SP-1A]